MTSSTSGSAAEKHPRGKSSKRTSGPESLYIPKSSISAVPTVSRTEFLRGLDPYLAQKTGTPVCLGSGSDFTSWESFLTTRCLFPHQENGANNSFHSPPRVIWEVNPVNMGAHWQHVTCNKHPLHIPTILIIITAMSLYLIPHAKVNL